MKHLSIITLAILMLTLLSFTQQNKKRLLVIGDSISLGYGPELKNMLANDFDYNTKETGSGYGNLDIPTGPNSGDSRMVLEYFRHLCKNKKFHTDLLVLNCGLHDIKTVPQSNTKTISKTLYKNDLDSIFTIIKKMKIRLIWVNTTPVNDSIHNSKRVGFYRYNKDVVEYNHIADSICSRRNIPVIDLYNFSTKFPVSAIADHVHFKPEFAKLQAAFIAGFIQYYKLNN